MISKSKFLRTTAALTVLCFLSTNLTASPLPAPAYKEAAFSSLVQKIEIPESLGRIQERFVPAEPSISAVIHIQDAHSSLEAQKHIYGILKYLQKNYKTESLFLEGGLNELRPELLDFFQDSKLNSKALSLFEKKGLIGGTERFLYEANQKGKKFSGYGIEESQLYGANLRAYRLVVSQKEASGHFLTNLQKQILTRSSHVFGKDLKDFFREYSFHQEHTEALPAYLKTLQEWGRGKAEVDLKQPRSQLDWPQLVRFSRLQDLEGQTDAAQAKKEAGALKAWMKKNKIEDRALETLIEKALNNRKAESPRVTLEKFYDRASSAGFSYEKYPELSKVLGRLVLQGELQAADLFAEIQKLSETILNTLAVSKEEKTLLQDYEAYLKLKRLFSLELLRADYLAIAADPAPYRPSEILKRVSEKPSEVSLDSLNTLFQRALSFYEGAVKRESAMYENLVREAKKNNQPVSVLITGGFHAPGLSAKLKEQGIAYVQVTPNISDLKDTNDYEKVMALSGTEKSSVNHPTLANSLETIAGTDPAMGNYYRSSIAAALNPLFRDSKNRSNRLTRIESSPAMRGHGLNVRWSASRLHVSQAPAVLQKAARAEIRTEGHWKDANEKQRLLKAFNPEGVITKVRDIEVVDVVNEASHPAEKVESQAQFFWPHLMAAVNGVSWRGDNGNSFIKDRADAALLQGLDLAFRKFSRIILRVISNEGGRDFAPSFPVGVLNYFKRFAESTGHPVLNFFKRIFQSLLGIISVDWWGDVLEGTNAFVKAKFLGAVSMGAFVPKGAAVSFPDFYLFRWAMRKDVDENRIRVSRNIIEDTEHNVKLLLENGKNISDVKIALLIRPRHKVVLQKLQEMGVVFAPEDAGLDIKALEKKTKEKGYYVSGNVTLIADGDMMPVFKIFSGPEADRLDAVIGAGGSNEVETAALVARGAGVPLKAVLLPSKALAEDVTDASIQGASFSLEERQKLLDHNLYPADVTETEKAMIRARIKTDPYALNARLTEEQRDVNHVWTSRELIEGKDGVFYASNLLRPGQSSPWLDRLDGIHFDSKTGLVKVHMVRAGLSGDMRVFKVTLETETAQLRSEIEDLQTELISASRKSQMRRLEDDIASRAFALARIMAHFQEYDSASYYFEMARQNTAGRERVQIEAAVNHYEALHVLLTEKNQPNEEALKLLQASLKIGMHEDTQGATGTMTMAYLLTGQILEKLNIAFSEAKDAERLNLAVKIEDYLRVRVALAQKMRFDVSRERAEHDRIRVYLETGDFPHDDEEARKEIRTIIETVLPDNGGTEYQLKDSETGHTFKAKTMGGMVTSLDLGAEGGELISTAAGGGSFDMSPWSSRLRLAVLRLVNKAVDVSGFKSVRMWNSAPEKPKHALHGLLARVPWKVTQKSAKTGEGASITFEFDSRQDPEIRQTGEFVKTNTYTLEDGVLTTATMIENKGSEELRTAFGFHQAFKLKNRSEWLVGVPAEAYWEVDGDRLPVRLEPTPVTDGAPQDVRKLVPLDRAFEINFTNLKGDKDGWVTAIFYNPNTTETIIARQQINPYQHLTLWVPDPVAANNPAFADVASLQPVTSAPNAHELSLNDASKGSNLIVIPAGQSVTAVSTVERKKMSRDQVEALLSGRSEIRTAGGVSGITPRFSRRTLLFAAAAGIVLGIPGPTVAQKDFELFQIIQRRADELSRQAFTERKVLPSAELDFPAFDTTKENEVQPAKISDKNGRGAVVYPRRGMLTQKLRVFYETPYSGFREVLFDRNSVKYPAVNAQGGAVPQRLPAHTQHWTQAGFFAPGADGFPQYLTLLADGYHRAVSLGSGTVPETIYGIAGRSFVQFGNFEENGKEGFSPELREIYVRQPAPDRQVIYQIYESPDAVFVQTFDVTVGAETAIKVTGEIIPRKDKEIRADQNIGIAGLSGAYKSKAAYTANEINVTLADGTKIVRRIQDPPKANGKPAVENFGTQTNPLKDWALESRYEDPAQFTPDAGYADRPSFYISGLKMDVDGIPISAELKTVLLSPDPELKKDNVVTAAVLKPQVPVKYGKRIKFSYQQVVKRAQQVQLAPLAPGEVQLVGKPGVVRAENIPAERMQAVGIEKGFGYRYRRNAGDFGGAFTVLRIAKGGAQTLSWDWTAVRQKGLAFDDPLPKFVQVKIEWEQNGQPRSYVPAAMEVNMEKRAQIVLPANVPAEFRFVLINEATRPEFTREPNSIGAVNFKTRNEIRTALSPEAEALAEGEKLVQGHFIVDNPLFTPQFEALRGAVEAQRKKPEDSALAEQTRMMSNAYKKSIRIPLPAKTRPEIRIKEKPAKRVLVKSLQEAHSWSLKAEDFFKSKKIFTVAQLTALSKEDFEDPIVVLNEVEEFLELHGLSLTVKNPDQEMSQSVNMSIAFTKMGDAIGSEFTMPEKAEILRESKDPKFLWQLLRINWEDLDGINPRLQAKLQRGLAAFGFTMQARIKIGKESPGKTPALERYLQSTYNSMPSGTIYEGANIGESGDLFAAQILRWEQEIMKKQDKLSKSRRLKPEELQVIEHMATGNTPWIGYTKKAEVLKTWDTPETQAWLVKHGIDPEYKPDVKRVVVHPLDALFPQKRTDYHSFANILTHMFERLGIPEENRRLFYGDVKDEAGTPMSPKAYKALMADIQEHGLLINEYLRLDELTTVLKGKRLTTELRGKMGMEQRRLKRMFAKHPIQHDYFKVLFAYSRQMAKELVERGGSHIFISGVGPSYEGKGHIGFMEAGTPFSQELLFGLIGFHMAADHMKENGGMATMWAKNGKEKFGFVTYGFAELLKRPDVKVLGIATGIQKARAIRRGVEERAHDENYPISHLKMQDVTWILDRFSAVELRYKTNFWDFEDLSAKDWTQNKIARLFIALSQEFGKPVSEISIEDFWDSDGGDDDVIRPVRKRNFASLLSKLEGNSEAEKWQWQRQKIWKRILNNRMRVEGFSKRLGLKRGSRITFVNPHLDDDVLAMYPNIRRMVKEGHEVTVWYTAPGYTAVHTDYAMKSLDKIASFSDAELKELTAIAKTEAGFQTLEKEYLNRLIKVIEKAKVPENLKPSDYDIWSLESAEEQSLRAKLLLLRLINQRPYLSEKLDTARGVKGFIGILQAYNQSKPGWGSEDLKIMKDIKVILRFAEAQSSLMRAGVLYENINYPLNASWYGTTRSGMVKEKDVNDVVSVFMKDNPDLVITPKENFGDGGAHDNTKREVFKSARDLKILFEAVKGQGPVTPQSLSRVYTRLVREKKISIVFDAKHQQERKEFLSAFLGFLQKNEKFNIKIAGYRGVWDRTPTTGLNNQASIIYSRQELEDMDWTFEIHFRTQSLGRQPVPDSGFPKAVSFSRQVLHNAKVTLDENELLGGLLPQEGAGILNFEYILNLNEPRARRETQEMLAELEAMRGPVERASATAVYGPVPYGKPNAKAIVRLARNYGFQLEDIFTSDELKATEILNGRPVRPEIRTIRDNQIPEVRVTYMAGTHVSGRQAFRVTVGREDFQAQDGPSLKRELEERPLIWQTPAVIAYDNVSDAIEITVAGKTFIASMRDDKEIERELQAALRESYNARPEIRTSELNEAVEAFRKKYQISNTNRQALRRAIKRIMTRELPGKEIMLRNFQSPPAGQQTVGRVFIEVDAGGTNIRVTRKRQKADGTFEILKQAKPRAFTKNEKTTSAEKLMDRIASSISEVLETSDQVDIEVTWSFPAKLMGINKAKVLSWNKGWNIPKLLGQDPVEYIHTALERRNIDTRKVKVTIIQNDTTRGLKEGRLRDQNTMVAAVASTGFNIAYYEAAKNISKRPLDKALEAINTEMGAFGDKKFKDVYEVLNKLLSEADLAMDASSSNPGEHLLEKVISSKYLAGQLQYQLRIWMKQGLIFRGQKIPYALSNRPEVFNPRYLSQILADQSPRRTGIGKILKTIGIKKSTVEEREAVYEIAKAIKERSAVFLAITLQAALEKANPGQKKQQAIALDSSLWDSMPGYKEALEQAFGEIAGAKSRNTRIFSVRSEIRTQIEMQGMKFLRHRVDNPKKTILVVEPISEAMIDVMRRWNDVNFDVLLPESELDAAGQPSIKGKLADLVKQGKYDIVLGYVNGTFDEAFFDAANSEGRHLELLASFGTGTDNIKKTEAAQRGTAVTNASGPLTTAMAELNIGGALDIVYGNKVVASGTAPANYLKLSKLLTKTLPADQKRNAAQILWHALMNEVLRMPAMYQFVKDGLYVRTGVGEKATVLHDELGMNEAAGIHTSLGISGLDKTGETLVDYAIAHEVEKIYVNDTEYAAVDEKVKARWADLIKAIEKSAQSRGQAIKISIIPVPQPELMQKADYLIRTGSSPSLRGIQIPKQTKVINAKKIFVENKEVLNVSLNGLTFGIQGFGKIGEAVAQRAVIMGMNIMAYQRGNERDEYQDKRRRQDWLANYVLNAYGKSRGFAYVEKQVLLKTSNILTTLIPPSDAETIGWIDVPALETFYRQGKLMGIINSGRGKIFGADKAAEQTVFEYIGARPDIEFRPDVVVDEPGDKSHLFRPEWKNIKGTGHTGSAVRQVRDAMVRRALEKNIRPFIDGQTPENLLVRPEIRAASKKKKGFNFTAAQNEAIDRAAAAYQLKPEFKDYLRVMVWQAWHPEAAQAPLKIQLHGEEGNYRLTAQMTSEEIQSIFKASHYATQVLNNAAYAEAAKNAYVDLYSLDGGLGENLGRWEFLEWLIKKNYLKKSDVTRGPDGRILLGAKGTDIRYPVRFGKKRYALSIAEAKLMQMMYLTETKALGGLRFKTLVNHQSAASYHKLLASPYLKDVLEGKKQPRTYAQVLEEKGIEVIYTNKGQKEFYIAQNIPAIKMDGKKVVEPAQSADIGVDIHGGHGMISFDLLHSPENWEPRADGKPSFVWFSNGDGLNSSLVSPFTIGQMILQNIPIMNLLTAASQIDVKGGKNGVKKVVIELPGGIRAEVEVPQQMELADAKANGQAKEFEAAGQPSGVEIYGEDSKGRQLFNTNVFVLQLDLLMPMLARIKAELGAEEYYKIIAPTRIEKPLKKGKDGENYQPVDGAIGTSIHNLNEFIQTTRDTKVLNILKQYGFAERVQKKGDNKKRLWGKGVLHFTDMDRGRIFTPTKTPFDPWMQGFSDYYVWDHEASAFKDAKAGLVPPKVSLEGAADGWWGELGNLIRAFGLSGQIQELHDLKIYGKVILSKRGGPVRLAHNVKIFNTTGTIADAHGKTHKKTFEPFIQENQLNLSGVTVVLTPYGDVTSRLTNLYEISGLEHQPILRQHLDTMREHLDDGDFRKALRTAKDLAQLLHGREGRSGLIHSETPLIPLYTELIQELEKTRVILSHAWAVVRMEKVIHEAHEFAAEPGYERLQRKLLIQGLSSWNEKRDDIALASFEEAIANILDHEEASEKVLTWANHIKDTIRYFRRVTIHKNFSKLKQVIEPFKKQDWEIQLDKIQDQIASSNYQGAVGAVSRFRDQLILESASLDLDKNQQKAIKAAIQVVDHLKLVVSARLVDRSRKEIRSEQRFFEWIGAPSDVQSRPEIRAKAESFSDEALAAKIDELISANAQLSEPRAEESAEERTIFVRVILKQGAEKTLVATHIPEDWKNYSFGIGKDALKGLERNKKYTVSAEMINEQLIVTVSEPERSEIRAAAVRDFRLTAKPDLSDHSQKLGQVLGYFIGRLQGIHDSLLLDATIEEPKYPNAEFARIVREEAPVIIADAVEAMITAQGRDQEKTGETVPQELKDTVTALEEITNKLEAAAPEWMNTKAKDPNEWPAHARNMYYTHTAAVHAQRSINIILTEAAEFTAARRSEVRIDFKVRNENNEVLRKYLSGTGISFESLEDVYEFVAQKTVGLMPRAAVQAALEAIQKNSLEKQKAGDAKMAQLKLAVRQALGNYGNLLDNTKSGEKPIELVLPVDLSARPEDLALLITLLVSKDDTIHLLLQDDAADETAGQDLGDKIRKELGQWNVRPEVLHQIQVHTVSNPKAFSVQTQRIIGGRNVSDKERGVASRRLADLNQLQNMPGVYEMFSPLKHPYATALLASAYLRDAREAAKLGNILNLEVWMQSKGIQQDALLEGISLAVKALQRTERAA